MICEISLSAGTGNLILSPVNGHNGFFRSFGGGGDNMFFYYIRNDRTHEWESGTGHMKDPVTLCRDMVISSSNNDAPVNFSPGPKAVVNDMDFNA